MEDGVAIVWLRRKIDAFGCGVDVICVLFHAIWIGAVVWAWLT